MYFSNNWNDCIRGIELKKLRPTVRPAKLLEFSRDWAIFSERSRKIPIDTVVVFLN